MMYEFERNKLYACLGKDTVSLLKEYKCFIAGGTITSLFCNRDINDIDIYFRDEKSLAAFLTDAWDDQLCIVSHTKKATLIKMNKVDVQLVHFAYFDSAQAIFDTFDFTVCMGAYDFATEEFVLHESFLQHNSQRILKFNKSTAFPIVSLLRVQKYRDKGYSISKPEMIRIALTCMTLDISSYAELKEQMGGMYGVNYDKLFDFADDDAKQGDGETGGTPFNLDTVIDGIADLYLDEDYFKEPQSIKFKCVDDIIDNIVNEKSNYLQIRGIWYKVNHNGVLVDVSGKPDGANVIDGDEYVRNLRLYKYVQKRDGRYYSYYDQKFEYAMGEVVDAKGEYKSYGSAGRLYFHELKQINKSPYKNHADAVLLEVSVEPEDWIDKDDHTVTVERCKVLREVPKEEVIV